MKIKYYLTIFVALSLIVLIGLTSYFLNEFVDEKVEQETYSLLRTAVNFKGESINYFVVNKLKQQDDISNDNLIDENYIDYIKNKNKKEYDLIKEGLVNIKIMQESLFEISLLNLEGEVIISTENSLENKLHYSNDRISNLNQNIEDHYIYIDPKDNCVCLISIIYDKLNNKVGFVFVEYSIKELFTIINLDYSYLKDSFEIYLVDAEGNILTPLRNPVKEITKINTENLKECLEHENIPQHLKDSKSYINYLGNEVYGAHYKIPDRNWCILAEMSVEEKLLDIKDNLFLFNLIRIILTTLFILLVTFFTSKYIGNQINNVKNEINKVSKGDLDINFKKSKLTEINNLTNSLSRVLVSLKLAVQKIGLTKEELKLGEVIKAKKEAEKKYKELFNNLALGVIVYEPINNGDNFIVVDMNKAGQQLSKVDITKIKGKKVTNVFKGVEKMGLFEVFKKVYSNGKALSYQDKQYKDKKLSAWFDNYIYKLPSGEIVAVYEDVTEKKRNEEQIIRKTKELERFAKLVIGREEKMIELKKKINRLEGKKKETIKDIKNLEKTKSKLKVKNLITKNKVTKKKSKKK